MAMPFTIHVPDQRLDEIRRKVEAYDWDQLADAGGWRSGVGKADLQRLVKFWLNQFDWREVERRLNRRPQFTTELDGQRLHFIHVAGNGTKPPLLLLHGWPGSFIEFEQMIDPLVADGHDVVVPSLPGFAFSHPIKGILGPIQIGELLHSLMVELFSEARYLVQGGDWGSEIATRMAYSHPQALLGIHLNMVPVAAADVRPTTTEEEEWQARFAANGDRERGYSHEQGTRPQTLGVAMADSPVGAAAWILEKFGVWSDLPKRDDGSPDLWALFSEEQLLTNIMLYVAPPVFVTATWIYQGEREEGADKIAAGTRVEVPTGVAAFPDPVFIPPPRSYAEKTYNITQWTEMPRGGHFAALEEPEQLLAELRRFIASVQKHH
ncbi:epoxide hydrolase family protein [Rhizobium leguminosarum]|uniref:epoxide hydrolase family protein n=1 Tax=Rhizobium leguminosarum TaxID=384 RepID=UPI003D08D4A9